MGSVYESERWRSLEPRDRSYLIPTMEDVRPGSLITVSSVLKPSLEYCLNEKGVKYKEDKSGYLIISKNELLLEEIALVRNNFQENKDNYHRSLGKRLFGYPECCVNYFIENVVYNNIKAGAEWWEKASEALKKGIYNDLFNYTFHVPCKLDCQETLRMAKEIKRVLELNDYEAAKYLREFNMEVLGK